MLLGNIQKNNLHTLTKNRKILINIFFVHICKRYLFEFKVSCRYTKQFNCILNFYI